MFEAALINHLHDHGVVAYPTSTLPGLACLPHPAALDTLFALKQRSSDKPVSLGVLSLEQAAEFAHVPPEIHHLEGAFPRGGFTFILDAREPLDARLGGARVAVRCLDHPTARGLVEEFGPITATSANESGELPEATAEAAGRILRLPSHAILPGACPGGVGSTIVNVVMERGGVEVTVMREGIIPSHSVVEWWKNRN